MFNRTARRLSLDLHQRAVGGRAQWVGHPGGKARPSAGNLIDVKDRRPVTRHILRDLTRGLAMPVDSIVVSVAVVTVFVVFAGVLLWGDLQSGSSRQRSLGRDRSRRGS